MAKNKGAVKSATPLSGNDPAFVTVACKLPHGLRMTVGNTTHVLRGALHKDAISGFGLTYVHEVFWNAWAAQHKNFKPLKLGLIFAQSKTRDAKAEAKEKVDEKSGLEPIDPDKPITTKVVKRDGDDAGGGTDDGKTPAVDTDEDEEEQE